MANSPYSEMGSGSGIGSTGIAGEVKAKLGEIAEPLKDKAEALAQEQMEAGTGHMKSLASAVHGAARELEAGMPRIATSVHDMAAKIEQTADDIRNNNVEELYEKFDRYARQQPAMVFGGAILAGIVLSRFLKSSSMGPVAPSATSESMYASDSMYDGEA